jgi:hypothetical protein
MARPVEFRCLALAAGSFWEQHRSVKRLASTGLTKYLEKFAGTEPELRPCEGKLDQVPHGRDFEFASLRLFEKDWALAFERFPRTEEGTGQDLSDARHGGDVRTVRFYEEIYASLQGSSTLPLVFVFESLPPNFRDRLVQKGIPFIVPGLQAFMPMYLVDLRERFLLPAPRVSHLKPAGQLALLFHLQCESLENLPLREVAIKLGYSPMMFTKIKRELEGVGLCDSEHSSRSVLLKFKWQGEELWQRAKAYMTSPFKGLQMGVCRDLAKLGRISGVEAIDRFFSVGILPPIGQSVYAVGKRVWIEFTQKLEDAKNEGERTQSAVFETWSYDPRLLSTRDTVDPLSLYLYMRDSPQPELSGAAESFLKRVLDVRSPFRKP